jgi:hypothetical protein
MKCKNAAPHRPRVCAQAHNSSQNKTNNSPGALCSRGSTLLLCLCLGGPWLLVLRRQRRFRQRAQRGAHAHQHCCCSAARRPPPLLCALHSYVRALTDPQLDNRNPCNLCTSQLRSRRPSQKPTSAALTSLCTNRRGAKARPLTGRGTISALRATKRAGAVRARRLAESCIA